MSHTIGGEVKKISWLGYLLGLVTAVDFASSLSISVANRHISGGVSAAPEEFVWILTVYAFAGVVVIPFIERLARRWHYRSLMLFGLLVFIVGAVWAGVSTSLDELLQARVVQGLGGGGLFTMARVYLQLSVPAAERPPQLRGYILGLLGCTAPVSWTTTWCVDAYGWRSVFVLQAIYGLSAVVLLWLFVKEEQHTPRSLGKIDWLMLLGFAFAMFLILHVLEDWQLQHWQWNQLCWFMVACVALIWAGYRLRADHDPLLNAHVINGRRYLVGLGFYAIYYLINGAVNFILPKLYGQGLDMPIVTMGMALSFSSFITVLMLPLYFLLAPYMKDRRRVIASGFLLVAMSLFWMSRMVFADLPVHFILLPMFLKGLFPVLGVVQIAGLTYREVPHQDFAHAYALKNIIRLLSGAVAASLASQYWMFRSAEYQTALVSRFDAAMVAQGKLDILNQTSSLHYWSEVISRQVSVLVGSTLLSTIALVCMAGGALVMCQRKLV